MEDLLIAARLTADACRHMANLKPYRWAPVPSLPAFMRGNDDGSGGKGGNEQDEEEEEDPEEPEGPEDEVKIKIEPTSLFS
ncbi:MAG: hypothetical protein M1815_004366 [Lichina confinis]|nr:MAG: hypothetical protein M1815_004366 [Lichina confinis]